MECITRRGLVSAASVAAGTAVVSQLTSTALADEQAAPPAWDATLPEAWDREVGCLVLGLGIAGCCAAVEAFDLGLDVLAVNAASSIIDCACTRSGGALLGVGSRIQKASGVEDDIETFVDDIRRNGGDAGDPKLIRAWGELSGETVDWLEDLGCEVEQQVFESSCHSVARYHNSLPEGSGIGWMYGLEAAIEERGIEVLYDTKVTRLYRGAGGRVEGAHLEAMDGSSTLEVKATDGVILAVGGLGRDLDAHREFTPAMAEVFDEAADVVFSASKNCLGNGYYMVRDIDGYVFNSPPTQGQSVRLNEENDATSEWLGFSVAQGAGAIEVNLNGERFYDESSFETQYNQKPFLKQPQMRVVRVFDEAALQSEVGQLRIQPFIDSCLECGSAFKADTLEDLAACLEIPADALVATVEDYNAHVDLQEPDEFGRTVFPAKIDQPPYYGALTDIVVGISKGGAKTDESARVIDTKGKVIPGLYAAGEVCFALLHGDARTHIVGGPNGSAAVWGRIAARSVAAGA